MEEIIEALMNGADADWYQQIEKVYNCRLEVWHEKHHQLQYTYYANIYANGYVLSVEIEDGINNGTRVRDTWEYANGWSNTREQRELIDFELSYTQEAMANQIAIATNWAKSIKPWLFERYRQQVYDNYVTGGNAKALGATNDTDRINLHRLQKMQEQRIYLEPIYKEFEVKKSFKLVYKTPLLFNNH
jgi:hypothetical protein